jgi:thiamine transport system permease protein
MPTLVVAAGFSALLGPNGLGNRLLMDIWNLSSPPLQFLNTFPAILTAHVFYNTTIVIRVVGDFWSRMDPRLREAAASLGASPGRVFRRITLPLIAPAILAAVSRRPAPVHR